MLSHGLRRRKRRAWQAAVLACWPAAWSLHPLLRRTPPHLATVRRHAALLAALLYFRGEFYAIGDPRTRWRALRACCAWPWPTRHRRLA